MCKLPPIDSKTEEYFVLKTECPNCGYNNLHFRVVDYKTHTEVTYKCLVCDRGFETKYKHHQRGE